MQIICIQVVIKSNPTIYPRVAFKPPSNVWDGCGMGFFKSGEISYPPSSFLLLLLGSHITFPSRGRAIVRTAAERTCEKKEILGPRGKKGTFARFRTV